MKEFMFDVKMFASIRVKAEDEKQARAMLRAEVDGAEANLGSWPDGSPMLCQICVDDDIDLIEVDGETV